MTRYICLINIICLFVQLASSQMVVVKDKETHLPLEHVSIFTEEPIRTDFTDAHGKCNLDEFAGADSIFFHMIGYETSLYSYDEIKDLGFQVLMRQHEMSLNEVVIAATKWQQGRRETPAKVSVMKPKEVQFANPQTTADLIGMNGDVYIQKSQMGGGSPMIRGFATNRVLIAVDGVRMNNIIFRGGNLQNIISADAYTLERAEVIFGPGSVIYGSDAIGGVMGLYTFNPALANEGKIFKSHASTRYSSANNESTGHFDLNFGREKWASYTSVTYSDFGDLKMGSHGPDGYLRHEYVIRENGEDKIVENSDPEKQVPTAYDQLNLMQKFKFVPNEDLNIDYGFHYSKTSDVERYDRHLQYNDDQLKYGDWYYGPQVWLMNNLQVSHKGKGSWYDDMRMIMAHQFFKESRHTRKLNKEDISRRTEKVHAYSFNVDFNKKLSSGKRLMYGAELVYNNNSSKGVDENIITGAKVSLDSRYPDDSDWLSAAIYANYTQKLGSKTNLQAGLRYNYIYLHTEFSDEFFDFQFDQSTLNNGALTGSLGVVHNPNENWQLSSSISTGFRSPNLDDVGKIFDSEPGSVVVPNPDLEPEYAINGEMGAAVVIRERLKLDWAVYYTYLNNAMVRDDFLFNGEEEIDYEGELSQVQAIQNAANAYVYGLQGGFEYKITEGLSASSRINYQKGEEETEDGIDSPLRHAAPWFGTTHLRYKREALKLDLNAQYNGEIANKDMPLTELSKTYMYAIDGNGNPYSPSWMVLNFRAQYAINHYTNLTAGIENILDKRYRPYSSGIVAPGRNFVVSLNLTL